MLVCDGFVGNVLLKFYESVAGFIIGLLQQGGRRPRAAELDLSRIFQVLDYTEYGGAPLLGVNGVTHHLPRRLAAAGHPATPSASPCRRWSSDMVQHIQSRLARLARAAAGNAR